MSITPQQIAALDVVHAIYVSAQKTYSEAVLSSTSDLGVALTALLDAAEAYSNSRTAILSTSRPDICTGYAKTRIAGDKVLEVCYAILYDGKTLESFERERSSSFHGRTWVNSAETHESIKAKAEYIGTYATAPLFA